MHLKSLLSNILLLLSFLGLLVSLFWDSLAVGSDSPLQQAARVACPFLHDNALANAISHLPLVSPSPPVPTADLPMYTPSQLSAYTSPPQILLGFAGLVYDVSPALHLFGPGQEFAALAGRHATRAILLSSRDPADCIADIANLELPSHATQSTSDILASHFRVVGRMGSA